MKNEIPIAGVAHQAGTVRFGADPATSVLDVNCKAHELDNLYVVDTSFFPSIGAVNPSLTAAREAARCAAFLVYGAGLGQVVALVSFPAASSVLVSPTGYDVSTTAYGEGGHGGCRALWPGLPGSWLSRPGPAPRSESRSPSPPFC